MSFQSLDVERYLLATILKYPQVFVEVENVISQYDFAIPLHQNIFSVIKQIILSKQTLEKIVLIEKLKFLNLDTDNEVNVSDYIENTLLLCQVSEKGIKTLMNEVKKFSVARQLWEIGGNIQKELKKNISKNSSELIALTDAIYNKTTNLYKIEDFAYDVFQEMEDLIEKRGKNPQDEIGYITPYPSFNKLYGGLRQRGVYCFASRAGQGKSTILADMSERAALEYNKEKNIKVLYLDTEIETVDFLMRRCAALSGVPFWYLDTGQWSRDRDMADAVRKTWSIIKQGKGRIFHRQVANKPIKEVCNWIKRWYYQYVGMGGHAIFVYDYLKLTGETSNNDSKEYAMIGDKMSHIHDLATFLNIPALSAVQMNRSGVTTNKSSDEVDDSEAGIAMSDRIMWFATNMNIVRRKTAEEMQKEGRGSSHKMINLKARYQGRESYGHHDLVKVTEGGKEKYKHNHINFNFDNFKVADHGTLRETLGGQINIEKKPTKGKNDEDKLL